MKRSELTALADHVFGPALSLAYRRELVLEALGGRTVDEALAAGIGAREAWTALCEAMDVPESSRWEIPAGARRD
ncbi:DUF3046 domain-containing protein [Brachybacterium sp. JHP9]|uniref:DUF3046 domain-containing protein n=1 Tax=Brachybacterium equifaecis TaxID=2910770 RepID=A0ABT0QWU8_9MICO|nr:DUF3046 domain-containing protein [Brachybacterium equifaecis]MCL6422075.1 DUF3046 domain-containing protein [Brachybacterium equifaecis]